MGDVGGFTGETTLPIDPDQVIRSALGRYPEGVLILGYDADEQMNYATSFDTAQDLIWLIECAKKAILDKWGDE